MSFLSRIFWVVLTSIVVTACVGTRVTSYVDPQHDVSKSFKRVIVLGDGMPLDELMMMEKHLAWKISARGLEAIMSSELAPLTQKYSDEEYRRIIRKSGAAAILTVVLKGKRTRNHYVPPTYHPGQTTATVHTFGSTAYVNTYTSPGYTTGGFSVEKPSANYDAKLLDLETGKVVWIASGKSRGGGGRTYRHLAKSMAVATVKKLIKDGLIHPKSPPQKVTN